MQFKVAIAADAYGVPQIERALREADPAASVDFDTGADQMRVSTFLSVRELVEIVDRAGLAAARERVVVQPSECCGGCGG
jgi:hypothetical protein